MPALPVNVDSSYADDGTHPDVKLHQQHHDALHAFYNFFEQAIEDDAWPDGGIPFWVDGDGQFSVIDPAISGSPGPTGPQGVGFTFMGDWDSGTTYHVYTANNPDAYEVVYYAGNAYVALATHSNSTPEIDSDGLPVASANWGVFLARGEPGVDGVNGSDGNTGPIGPKGDPGPSRESLATPTDTGTAVTLDTGVDTGYILTLTDDCTLSLQDSAGTAFSAASVRLYMGAGGPYTVTYPDVLFWNTADGNPPDLSGMNEGDAISLVFDQMAGDWWGHSRAASGPPAPDTFPTLDMDPTPFVAAYDNTDVTVAAGATSYTYANLGAAVQVGAKKGGVLLVQNARRDNTDPAIPTVTGGGATWVQGETRVLGTGTVRRRGTLFYCRDASPGPAAPFSVTTACSGLGGELMGMAAVFGFRTAGNVPDTFVATALAQGSQNGGTTANVTCTLDTAANANNRPIVFIFSNTYTSPGGAITPEAGGNWEEVGAQLNISTGNQVGLCHCIWNQNSAADTSFTATGTGTGTWGPGTTWVVLATELVQG